MAESHCAMIDALAHADVHQSSRDRTGVDQQSCGRSLEGNGYRNKKDGA